MLQGRPPDQKYIYTHVFIHSNWYLSLIIISVLPETNLSCSFLFFFNLSRNFSVTVFRYFVPSVKRNSFVSPGHLKGKKNYPESTTYSKLALWGFPCTLALLNHFLSCVEVMGFLALFIKTSTSIHSFNWYSDSASFAISYIGTYLKIIRMEIVHPSNHQ